MARPVRHATAARVPLRRALTQHLESILSGRTVRRELDGGGVMSHPAPRWLELLRAGEPVELPSYVVYGACRRAGMPPPPGGTPSGHVRVDADGNVTPLQED